MKPPFHNDLSKFDPELNEAMNRLGERIGAVLEMTPVGQPLSYDGSLQIDCECETCTLSSDCPCRVCRKVFSPNSGRGSDRMEDV